MQLFDRYSQSKIWDAFIKEKYDFLIQGLEKGKIAPNYQFNWGGTFLNEAIISRKLRLAKKLIECGADVNKFDNHGRTALMCLVEQRRSLISDKDYLNKLQSEDEEMVLLLKEAGADFDKPDSDGKTALVRLINESLPIGWRGIVPPGTFDDFNSYKDGALLLIQYGADINRQDNTGQTPLFAACAQRSLQALSFLLSRGANIHLTDNQGKTALMTACESKSAWVSGVERLVAAGSNINHQDEKGETALMKAVSSENKEIVSLLIQRSADVTKEDEKGETALMKAIQIENLELVKTLIDSEANVFRKNHEGTDAFNLAMQKGNLLIGEMLKTKVREVIKNKMQNRLFFIQQLEQTR